MKKKLLFLSLLLALPLTLASCTWIFPTSSSSTSTTSTSKKPTSTSKTSTSKEPGTIEAVEKNLTYNNKDIFNNSYYSNVDCMPSTGNVNFLVIPVLFTNISISDKATLKSKIQTVYFGTQQETGWHSVKTYYETESNNQLQITGTVSDWYQSSYKSTLGDEDVLDLADDAVNWYKTTYSTNCKEFDSDGNGIIDYLALIYGAPHDGSTLWAYTAYTYTKTGVKESPVANPFVFASYDFMATDKRYCSYDAHTYIHETGHMLGLEDYYNYDSRSSYNAAGRFSMQDYNIGAHDPFSKLSLGWCKPTLFNGYGTTSVELTPCSEGGNCIILSNKSANDFVSPFDEYLLLEYYTPTGLNAFDCSHSYDKTYPTGPLTSGIRLWHVDGRLLKNYNGLTVNLVTNPVSGSRYKFAMSNSTDSSHGSLVEEFRNYKLLHLLQAGGVNTYKMGNSLSSSDLFKSGNSFNMNSYKNFFVNTGKLNSGDDLDISFTVTSLTNSKATIEITRN